MLAPAEDEGSGDGTDAGAEQDDAERVQAVGEPGARFGQQPLGGDDGGDADRHVHEEDRPPPQT
ncbi:MAG TPA: hypothetical protein VGI06_03460, partial [Acidimicrobiales bacterium]